jgi:hypothetical protein
LSKGCNFGYLFGAGPKKIDTTTHTTGLYPVLTELFPEAHSQIRKDIEFVRTHGFIYASGYRLFVPPDAPYAATVYKIQGYEGLIAKRAMVDCNNYLESIEEEDIHLVLCNHDELIFDAPVDANNGFLITLCRLMELAGAKEGITCKVDAKIITDNWAMGSKFKL